MELKRHKLDLSTFFDQHLLSGRFKYFVQINLKKEKDNLVGKKVF